MAINELIARGGTPIQFESPMNQLAKVLQMQQMQQGVDKGQIEQEQYRAGIERKNNLLKLMSALPGDATDEQRSAALKGGSFFDEADKLDKGVLERTKIKSEAQYKQAETLSKYGGTVKQLAGYVFSQPTVENAVEALKRSAQYHKMLGLGDLDISGEMQALQGMTSPDQIKQWAAGHSMDADKLLPKNSSENAGGNWLYNSTDPLTGKVTQTGTAPITQTADNAATQATSLANNAANNERMAKEGAASRGNAMAIAKMADARSRDANTIARDTKPLTEGQSKSALFGSRMAMANQIFDTLEQSGTTTSTPGMNSGYGIGSVVNALSGKDQQQLMQAKRDFLNAVLRRESGAVIGESEFANGEQQYFPQIGDKPENIAQKKANREAAMRGVLIDVPSNKRDEIVGEITGQSASKGGATKGKFKYLGTE